MNHTREGIHSRPSFSQAEAPCKACTDFKTWAFSKTNSPPTTNPISKEEKCENQLPSKESPAKECPLDRQELGRNSWSVLHTIAAYYSENPTLNEQKEMQQFISLFAKFYPCHDCSEDFIAKMSHSPPMTQNRYKLSEWLCQMHNQVNVKLGKPEFDCANVFKRWRDGWSDGSC